MSAITEFKYINSKTILASTLDGNGNQIGGLSGITYNAASNTYYVISDGRNVTGSPGPARFYTLNPTIDREHPNLARRQESGDFIRDYSSRMKAAMRMLP